ncbi:MAG TPA: hypothetical protein PLI24_06700 [Candidatus Cloacimonas sp.]|jgi:hypothetical protein|nr:hypothetical protein [Candidatus Cloacimonas sp.]MBP9037595.1 hypothetical protein [Candidatus Cloacimonas sp.]HOG26269.1 hypothetical protein [Candidatus Cloacimonas sp.]HOQ77589.1 hypothetical protein [Candidatus Cloacimonas sp.]HPV64504.1 hypothetical protein [Candidatus Cloacimonas sp.]
MKTFKFVLVSLCIMSMLTSWVSIEAKKKEEDKGKEVESKLFLDDSKLDNQDYYNQFPSSAIQSFENALLTPKVSDIKIITINSDQTKTDAKIAEEMIAVALGMRQEYVNLEAEGKSLLSGNLEGSELEISEMVKAKLEDLKTAKAQLSESQKVYFLSGFTYLASSIVREKVILESAKMYVDEASKATGMAKMKYAKDLPYATAVVTDIPILLESQIKTINEFATIAKTQSIKIPENVTKSLFE